MDFHSRERPNNLVFLCSENPLKRAQTHFKHHHFVYFDRIFIGYLWQAVVVIEARQVDKSRQKLHGGVLQNTDLCWQAFLSFPSLLPPRSIFSLVPISCAAKLSKSRFWSFSALKTHRNACYAGYWMISFLDQRKQRVVVDECYTTYVSINRGVPPYTYMWMIKTQWTQNSKTVYYIV